MSKYHLFRHNVNLSVFHRHSRVVPKLLLPERTLQRRRVRIWGHRVAVALCRAVHVHLHYFLGTRRRREEEGNQRLLLLAEFD